MKTVLTIVGAFVALAASAQTYQTNPNHEHVRGYTKENGTYVAPHERTAPNNTDRDNYNTKGNYNPSNGQEGTRTPKEEKETTEPKKNPYSY